MKYIFIINELRLHLLSVSGGSPSLLRVEGHQEGSQLYVLHVGNTPRPQELYNSLHAQQNLRFADMLHARSLLQHGSHHPERHLGNGHRPHLAMDLVQVLEMQKMQNTLVQQNVRFHIVARFKHLCSHPAE